MRKTLTAVMAAFVMLAGTVAISSPAEAARKSQHIHP